MERPMSKWMLVVMVFGTAPVPTGISFDNLQECWKAEEAMRAEYTKAYNSWMSGRRTNIARRSSATGQGRCFKAVSVFHLPLSDAATAQMDGPRMIFKVSHNQRWPNR